ncbi:MAG: adenosylcobinamide-GDP ribazoletransferase [Rhodobacteraceae bacterium]|nr:adenosylcobinamide-GDP ribazoletransferase [Paracoccaceae bacterium]
MRQTGTDFALKDITIAGILLTRLPLPHLDKEDFADQARSVWAYPLIGLGLGCGAALVFAIAAGLGLPQMAAAGLALALLTVVTGAMHEDGLADTADGLWGGFDRDRRLEIMKDSRIGAYGVLALIFVTGLRWMALAAAGPWALIVSATASRSLMAPVMARVPHARGEGLSHSVGRPSDAHAWVSLGIAGIVALLTWGFGGVLAFGVAGVCVWALTRAAIARIGGQTGDILGASQQISEMVILLALAALSA